MTTLLMQVANEMPMREDGARKAINDDARRPSEGPCGVITVCPTDGSILVDECVIEGEAITAKYDPRLLDSMAPHLRDHLIASAAEAHMLELLRAFVRSRSGATGGTIDVEIRDSKVESGLLEATAGPCPTLEVTVFDALPAMGRHVELRVTGRVRGVIRVRALVRVSVRS